MPRFLHGWPPPRLTTSAPPVVRRQRLREWSHDTAVTPYVHWITAERAADHQTHRDRVGAQQAAAHPSRCIAAQPARAVAADQAADAGRHVSVLRGRRKRCAASSAAVATTAPQVAERAGGRVRDRLHPIRRDHGDRPQRVAGTVYSAPRLIVPSSSSPSLSPPRCTGVVASHRPNGRRRPAPTQDRVPIRSGSAGAWSRMPKLLSALSAVGDGSHALWRAIVLVAATTSGWHALYRLVHHLDDHLVGSAAAR